MMAWKMAKKGIAMKLIFVHGWSVTHTDTYGQLPNSLVEKAVEYNIKIEISEIFLGKYVSFNDDITLDDVAIALNKALHDLPGNQHAIQPFSCITHSTGGPVVRHWLQRFYGSRKLPSCPLKHLLMLAPANHGSALAVLGKKQVSRLKAWFEGIEPGLRILDWLCLGSKGQWILNRSSLTAQYAKNGLYPFVFTGQGIDQKVYDFLNAYLIEPGSDGVIRVPAANLNYKFCSLVQTDTPVPGYRSKSLFLNLKNQQSIKSSAEVPLAVFHGLSHSGKKMGIMASRADNSQHQQLVVELLKSLKVNSIKSYQSRIQDLKKLSEDEQKKVPVGKKESISRFCMLIFHVHDENNNPIQRNDCDVLLLAGKNYKEHLLPDGFFQDRQYNKNNHTLIYYLNYDKLIKIKDQKFGIKIIARPFKGFAYYIPAEFHSDDISLEKLFSPNETSYFDITLKRQVDKNVFRFQKGTEKQSSFKKIKPSGESV